MNRRSRDPDEPAITPEAIEAARLYPCGWVSLVEGTYSGSERPPVWAIVGAWRVDARGNIVVSDYVSNACYRPSGLALTAWCTPAMAWPPESKDAIALPEPETKYLH